MKTRKPVKKSLVRRLRDTIALQELEKLMLAKLAAETPQFFNPFHVYRAKKLRDSVLTASQNEQ